MHITLLWFGHWFSPAWPHLATKTHFKAASPEVGQVSLLCAPTASRVYLYFEALCAALLLTLSSEGRDLSYSFFLLPYLGQFTHHRQSQNGWAFCFSLWICKSVCGVVWIWCNPNNFTFILWNLWRLQEMLIAFFNAGIHYILVVCLALWYAVSVHGSYNLPNSLGKWVLPLVLCSNPGPWIWEATLLCTVLAVIW